MRFATAARAVAAVFLGPVQRPVDNRKQVRDRGLRIAAKRDADADARAQALIAEADCGGGEVAPHPIGNGVSLVDVADRHAARKFLAADAREQDIGAERLRRRTGEGLQHRIADRVSELIVDLLEVIEIEQQHRERLEVGLLPSQQTGGAVKEGAPVGDAA